MLKADQLFQDRDVRFERRERSYGNIQRMDQLWPAWDKKAARSFKSRPGGSGSSLKARPQLIPSDEVLVFRTPKHV